MSVWRVWVLFAGALGLYCLTLAPTFLWSDSAKLALFTYEKQFVASGFGGHPGHTILGYLFSFLPFSFAYTQNLMSALFGALSIVVLFCIVRRRASDAVAMISSAAFAVSHLFWHYSVINETYSLLIFFIALLLLLVLRASDNPACLYWACLVLGFGFANHGAILLAVPGCILLLWEKKVLSFIAGPRLILLALLFFLGSAQVFILPFFFRDIVGGGVTTDLLRNLDFFWHGFAKLRQEAARYPLYLLYQFPTISIFFGIYGFIILSKKDRRYALATIVTWMIFIVFSLQYFYQRQFAFLIPSFFIFALWIPEGLTAWIGWSEKFVSRKTAMMISFLLMCVLPGVVYFSAYKIATERNLKFSAVRELPYRNNLRYFLFPPKHFERGAELYAGDALRQAAPNAVILADFNPGMAILYAQKILNMRPDISVVLLDPWLFTAGDPVSKIIEFLQEQVKQGNPVYLADNWEAYYKTSAVRKNFELKQEGGPLWRVTTRDR